MGFLDFFVCWELVRELGLSWTQCKDVWSPDLSCGGRVKHERLGILRTLAGSLERLWETKLRQKNE